MSINIVNDALKFYDRNGEKYQKIKKKIKFVKHAEVGQNELEGVRLVFYDKDKKEIFASRVEILGKYYVSIKTWVWGWSLPQISKSLTTIIRKVFLYGTDIDVDIPDNILLKNELITSRFRVDDDIQIEIHCAIASYLAKKPLIFMWKSPLPKLGEMGEVLSEFDKIDVDVIYYTFILDPPDVESQVPVV